MPDPSQVYARILEALKVKNGAQAAQKLGFAKPSVYAWENNLPGLDSLIKIAELGNSSLDWLLTGQHPTVSSKLDAALDEKIRQIVREELSLNEKKHTLPIVVGDKKTAAKKKSA